MVQIVDSRTGRDLCLHLSCMKYTLTIITPNCLLITHYSLLFAFCFIEDAIKIDLFDGEIEVVFFGFLGLVVMVFDFH